MRLIKYILVAFLFFYKPLFVLSQKQNAIVPKNGFITINVKFKEAQKSDSLFLIIDNILYKNSEKNNLGSYSATVKNKWFRFVIPVSTNCGYWDLYKSRTFTARGGGSNRMILMQDFFWEKGDNIKIQLSNRERQIGISSSYTFEGEGSKKYTARKLADSIYLATQLPDPQNFQIFDKEFNFQQYDQKGIDAALIFLFNFKDQISRLSYEVLKADVLYKGNTGYNFPKRISNFYSKHLEDSTDAAKSKFLNAYKSKFGTIKPSGLSMVAFSHSKNYLFYLCNKFQYESYFLFNKYDSNWIIENIIENTDGIIRDQVLLATFLSIQKFDNVDQLYRKVRPLITDANCLKVLSRLQAAGPGKPFVNFDLPDVNGKRIHLSDFKDKIVLIDFWFNGCPGCANFYKNTLKMVESDFKGSDQIVFISICGDISRTLWLDGINGGDYTSMSAVNLYTDGKGFKHPIVVDNIGGGFPFVVLIDKAGVIKNLNSPDLYTYPGLTKAIKSL